MTRIYHPDGQAETGTAGVERVPLTRSAHAVVVRWRVSPGQSLEAHRHPHGQDTWIVLEGEAEYFLGSGEISVIRAGSIAIAAAGEVHGARNLGSVPFVFVSVLGPVEAGYEPASP